MDRKKVIYIGIILIITVMLSITYFSYAFFIRNDEQHGKLNVTVGTLDYSIKSSFLNNNKITLAANTEKQLDIEITSLNNISSKYEIYYKTSNNNVEVKYSTLGDLPSGTIASNAKKNLILKISNSSNSSATITFGVKGGFIYNDLALESGNSISALSPLTVTFDSNKGNLMDNNTLVGNNVQKNGIDYVINGSDCYFPSETFDEGKEYILSFKLQKTSGTLLNIGGHAAVASQLAFTIDGNNGGVYFFNSASGAPRVTNLTDDTNVHTIIFRFKYLYENNNNGNKKIYIQPNRGRSEAVSVKVTDITLTEVSTSKSYVYGEEYGSLPTPTRTGYTFKGWNGKNLLNLDVPSSTPGNTTSSNTTKRTFTTNTYVKGLAFNNYFNADKVTSLTVNSDSINMQTSSGYGVGFPLLTGAGKNYVLTSKMQTTGTEVISSALFYKSDGTLLNYFSNIGNGERNNFTSPANTYYMVIEFTTNGNDAILNVNNIQLENGTLSTPYEPYCISEDTKVTQSSNHTLTAIWEKVN